MGFFGDLWDNTVLTGAVIVDKVNPFNDAGTAPLTARLVEEQLAEREGRAVNQARIDATAKVGGQLIDQAATKTVKQIGEKADFLAGALPWILGGAALIALAVVAGPYVQVLAKATK